MEVSPGMSYLFRGSRSKFIRVASHEKERNLSGLLLFSLGFVTHRVQKAFILKPTSRLRIDASLFFFSPSTRLCRIEKIHRPFKCWKLRLDMTPKGIINNYFHAIYHSGISSRLFSWLYYFLQFFTYNKKN